MHSEYQAPTVQKPSKNTSFLRFLNAENPKISLNNHHQETKQHPQKTENETEVFHDYPRFYIHSDTVFYVFLTPIRRPNLLKNQVKKMTGTFFFRFFGTDFDTKFDACKCSFGAHFGPRYRSISALQKCKLSPKDALSTTKSPFQKP